MIPALIKFFNCVAVKPGQTLLNPRDVNLFAAKCGYLVHPDACTYDVIDFLESRKSNLNTTFYKSWHQVETLEEAEMRILQLVHYLTTYGTDYKGKTFTMNEFPEEMSFTELTLLMPCSEEDLMERIQKMFESGVALSSDTVKQLFKQLDLFKKDYGWTLDPERIRNKEAKSMYYLHEEIYPYEPFDLMRILMYVCRGDSMIINDAKTVKGIDSNINLLMKVFLELDERHLEVLASVFYRYKKIFLTMRRMARKWKLYNSPGFISRINRLRRMAVKYHVPFKPGVLQTVLQNHPMEKIEQAVEEESSVFQLVKVLNYLNGKNFPSEISTFIIRNGKVYVKKNEQSEHSETDIRDISLLVRKRIVSLLAKKAHKADGQPVTVKFPAYLELAAPVSEKMFIGNVPYGSKYFMQKNNYIGVYWRNEWGTKDFDLWIVGANGQRIGWAADHKDGNILFSGDMTNADPEATEIMYCKDKWPDCTIRVSRYNGIEGSTFRIFFGRDNIDKLPLNYMVNPDSIQFQEDLVSKTKETVIGIVHDNVAYFAALGSGEGRVPQEIQGIKTGYEKSLYERISNYVSLKELLLEAGYAEFDPESNALPDIDLSANLNKDTLISLMTVENED